MVTEVGLNLEKGNALWERAKSVIPGGNGLISKRPDRHVPDLWPPYFSKSKGCKLWDLDGNEFFDFSYMGLGASLLGYCDDFVDDAVRKAVSDGVSSHPKRAGRSTSCREAFGATSICWWSEVCSFRRGGNGHCRSDCPRLFW